MSEIDQKDKKRYLLIIMVITAIMIGAEVYTANLGVSIFFIVLFGTIAVAYIYYDKFAKFFNRFF